MTRFSLFIRTCLTGLCVLAASAAHADRVKDLATLRSLMWLVGWVATIYLYVQALS